MRMEYARDNIEELTKKVFSYFVIIGFILVSFSILFGDDLMSFVFVNKEFAGASKVFPIIMLALLFYSFQNIVDFGIYLYKKVIFYSVVALIGIAFNVTMNYWLIPDYGYMASAYVTFFTYFLTSSLIYLVSSYYYKIKFEWSRILFPFFFIIFLYYLTNFTSIFHFNSILKKSFVFVFLLLLFAFYWLNKNEKENIRKFL